MSVPKHIQELLEGMESSITKAILEAIGDIKSEVKLREVISAFDRGGAEEIIKVLQLGEDFLEPIHQAIRTAIISSGTGAIQVAMTQSPRANRLVIRFSGSSPEVEKLIKAGFTRAAQAISEASRDAIRGIVSDGVMRGRSPSSISLDIIGRLEAGGKNRIGGVIGLNSNLVSYLNSARDELESGDPSLMRNYLTRVLRDKRYDSIVRSSIEKGKTIKKATVESILSEYADGLLQFRARTIARTEAISAMNGGRHAAYSQMVEKGLVDESDIKRRWRSGGDDGKTRDTHLSMDDPQYVVTGLKDPLSVRVGLG